MQRLILRSILNLALFILTLSLASRLMAGISYLLLQAGSPVLRDWIQSHFAWRALVLGILAGISPASLCFRGFLWFAPDDNPDAPRISRFFFGLNVDAVQQWTVLFFSPLLIKICLGWVRQRSQGSSVLIPGNHYSIASFVEYWNDELSYADIRSHLSSAGWGWMSEVLRIWILAASAGYSLAPSLRRLGLSVYHRMYLQPTISIGDGDSESTMNEKIDPE